MTNVESKVPTVIRNEVFYAFARLCMVVATVIGLPIAGWMLNRVAVAADEIRTQMQAQNVALQVLTNEVKYHFAATEDHEQRLRRLEFGAAH